MSADVLREAARLMRERTDGLAGPWKWYGDHLVWPSEAGPAANDPIAGVGPDHESAAEHIASWHPDVALAVADLLDREADTHECALSIGARGLATDDKALTVARAYLETSPDPAPRTGSGDTTVPREVSRSGSSRRGARTVLAHDASPGLAGGSHVDRQRAGEAASD